MNDHLVKAFSYQALELLFAPPGLPVVNKGASAPTTSIAILGDAGAGKTTLAVAVGHAIATDLGGTALCLTTELAPTEIKYKVTQLGLETRVLAWKHRAEARPGDLIGQHVALVDDLQTGSVRKRALEAAWQLAEDVGTQPPVRCVVIDAFPLPDEASGSTRDDVVELVQALESRGISVIIVQETTTETDFIPFVTDIVFQLKFDTDRDTGEQIRKLACPKSRYARSIVGPHDTGVDHGRISVWPDPLSILTNNRERALPIVATPASMFFPLEKPDSIVIVDHGGVLLSKVGQTNWLLRLVLLTPGVEIMRVNCGPVSYVDGGQRVTSVPDSEGAYSLAWAIFRVQQQTGRNTVLIQDLESLLRRARFNVPLQHMLEALRLCQMLVVVHTADTDQVRALSDFEGDGRYRRSSGVPTSSYRFGADWMYASHWPARSDTSGARQAVHRVERIVGELVSTGATAEVARDRLEAVTLQTDDPVTRTAQRLLGTALHLFGFERLARDRVPTSSGDEGYAACAWANSATGRDWEASHLILAAARRGAGLEKARLLWAALTATLATSEPATQLISTAVDTVPALLHHLIRALARRDRWVELDASIERVARTHEIPAFLRKRIEVEARLEGSDVHRLEAIAGLEGLSKDETIPAIHRAAVLHNRAVALTHIGRFAEARTSWERALELNPLLEIASKIYANHSIDDEAIPAPDTP